MQKVNCTRESQVPTPSRRSTTPHNKIQTHKFPPRHSVNCSGCAYMMTIPTPFTNIAAAVADPIHGSQKENYKKII